MRIAVIGLGIGAAHARVLAEMEAADLVGVCDLRRDKAEEVARICGTEAFGDWETMVAQARPEAVCLCTNPASHLPIGAALARAGIHVLCEKPMAPTVEQCLALAEACDDARVVLMIAHKKRFAPAIWFLKQHVGGDFGKPISLNYRFHPGQVPKDWFWQEDDGGGPILENSVHVFDTLRHVVGEIRAVRGIGGNLLVGDRAPQIDIALGLVEFENDCVGAVELGTASEWCVADEEFFIACEDAVARSRGAFDRPDEVLYVYRQEQQPRTFTADYAGESANRDFVAEIAHFMDCITTGATPLVSGWEGTRSVACCLAMKRAVREGAVVAVQD